jgi:hypothetical protein
MKGLVLDGRWGCFSGCVGGGSGTGFLLLGLGKWEVGWRVALEVGM